MLSWVLYRIVERCSVSAYGAAYSNNSSVPKPLVLLAVPTFQEESRRENHTEAPAIPFLAPPSGRPRESQFNTVGGEDAGGLAGDCERD